MGGSVFCGDILGRIWGGLGGRKNLGLLLVKSDYTSILAQFLSKIIFSPEMTSNHIRSL